MTDQFKAMIVEEQADGRYARRVGTRTIADLPAGDLLIRVACSSLNYKDALSATGNKGVTRNYPHTPGIDAAGEVVEDSSQQFAPGDRVLVTGWDLGMNTPGGYGEYIRVPADWALPLPAGLTLRESMILGTAGLTAGLCVQALCERITPDSGPILVTGATGGVGSLAVAILHRAGYQVVAVTGKADQADFLRRLGADEVIERGAVLENAERPMLKERWAGAVDVVGGPMLAAILKATRYGGSVACCGLVGSPELPINVFPFILRGVSLLGIDSVQAPKASRQTVWNRLGGDWRCPLEDLATEVPLEKLEAPIQAILQGQLKGRVLVNVT
ncbi:MAG: YhdH/YhfP family quinone oxidoreductase [Desulfuromonadales bacterium]|nr:YhdH/YhfP family quinone oxidoreductase [Desulfuromonadales bacterium]